MKAIGRITWEFADDPGPLQSYGEEPYFVTAEKLRVLNKGEKRADVEKMDQSAVADPAGPFWLPVDDPHASVLPASGLVPMQGTRRDSGQSENARRTPLAFPAHA